MLRVLDSDDRDPEQCRTATFPAIHQVLAKLFCGLKFAARSAVSGQYDYMCDGDLMHAWTLYGCTTMSGTFEQKYMPADMF